jgi:hypothetical protein
MKLLRLLPALVLSGALGALAVSCVRTQPDDTQDEKKRGDETPPAKSKPAPQPGAPSPAPAEPKPAAPSPSAKPAADGPRTSPARPDARGGWLSDGGDVVAAPRPAPEAPRPAAKRSAARAPRDPFGKPSLTDERTPFLALRSKRPPGDRDQGFLRAVVPAWQTAAIALLALALGAGLTFVAIRAGTDAGRVEIYAYPEVPSRVRIDGVDHGHPPITLDTLTAGTHVVEIEAEGFRSINRPIIVRPDNTVSVHVELAPEVGGEVEAGAGPR